MRAIFFQTLGAFGEGVFDHRAGEGQRLFTCGFFNKVHQQVHLVQEEVGGIFRRIVGRQHKADIRQTVAHTGRGFRQAQQRHRETGYVDFTIRAFGHGFGIGVNRQTDGRVIRIAVGKVQTLFRAGLTGDGNSSDQCGDCDG